MFHKDKLSTHNFPWWGYLPLYISPVLLFLPALMPGRALFWGITSIQFVPWHWEALRSLQAGELPLWNIWNGMGAPLAANYQSAVFYPPTWLTLLAGWVGGLEWMAWSHGVLIVLHLIWAGIGMSKIMKQLGLSPIPQVICGLAFSLCGYFIGRGSFLTMVQAAAWIPWVVLAANQIASPVKGSLVNPIKSIAILWLALAYSGQWLSGHAQLSWYTLLFSLVWLTVGALVNGGWKRLIQIIPVVTVSGLLAFLLCSIQLLPTIEYFIQSQRSGAIDFQTALSYSYWPWRLLSLVFPDIFGNPGTGDFWGYANYWEDAAYFGLLPLFFSFYYLLTWKKRQTVEVNSQKQPLVWLSLISVGVVFLFALGWNTPVFPWLFKNIPTFGAFNGPTRWMIIMVFCLIILAGLGVEEWIRHPIARRNQIFMMLVGVIAMLLAGIASIITMPYVKESFKTSLIAGALLLSGYLLISLFKPAIDDQRKIQIWRYAFVIWLMVDLIYAGWRLNPAVDVSLYAAVKNESRDRYYLPQDSEKDLRFKRFFNFEDIRETRDWKNLTASYLPNANILSSVEMVNNFDPMLPDRYLGYLNELEKAAPETRDRLLSLANTGQIAEVGTDSPYSLFWEAVEAYPRLWMTGCAETVKNDEEALNWVINKTNEGVLDSVIVIETDDTSQQACEKLHPSELLIEKISRRSLVQEVTGSEKERYLFIADTWYPGWTASIDGKETRIYRADYVFMAIKIPAGGTIIRLEYKPPSFLFGSLLTLAGIIFCVILGFWRKSPSGGSF